MIGGRGGGGRSCQSIKHNTTKIHSNQNDTQKKNKKE